MPGPHPGLSHAHTYTDLTVIIHNSNNTLVYYAKKQHSMAHATILIKKQSNKRDGDDGPQ
jgi:hypothetical protein